MAINFSQVKAITIPEGSVKKIEINGVTVWSAGSSYIWTEIATYKTIGSASQFTDIEDFATVPSNATAIRLTLSYPQGVNSYSFYEININNYSSSTVNKNLNDDRPTTLTIPLDGSTYLLAVRYRSQNSTAEKYQYYWYLEVYEGKLSLYRTYQTGTTPSSSIGLYPISISKIEAQIPNPS